MDISSEVNQLIGQPESEILEYKAVLPPSRHIAQLIGSFANTRGGYLILGVSEKYDASIEVNGLSEDFHAIDITRKALDLLVPSPTIYYQYVIHNGKRVFAIKVEKAASPIIIEGKEYVRVNDKVKISNYTELVLKTDSNAKIKEINSKLIAYKQNATSSKNRLIDHYQSIIKIIDDLGRILYPVNIDLPTSIQEGKILSRIIYSSFVDTFETYLSDLLYEIFLANPKTLKTQEQVTVEEVLNCSDLQDFVIYWATKKIGKLQKGSVKGFIKENKQIQDLNVLDQVKQDDIEKLLEIRHLYSHRNGIVDEKFLKYFPGEFQLNSEHQLSVSQICSILEFLADIVNLIDAAAISKYKLAQVNTE